MSVTTGTGAKKTSGSDNWRTIISAHNESVDAYDAGKAAAVIFAAPYDSTATYAVGDQCTHDGRWYAANQAISTAEDWTAAHWTELNVGGQYYTKTQVDTSLSGKVNTSDIYNGLDQTSSGTALDARQGKELNEAIANYGFGQKTLSAFESALDTYCANMSGGAYHRISVQITGATGEFAATNYTGWVECPLATRYSVTLLEQASAKTVRGYKDSIGWHWDSYALNSSNMIKYGTVSHGPISVTSGVPIIITNTFSSHNCIGVMLKSGGGNGGYAKGFATLEENDIRFVPDWTDTNASMKFTVVYLD